MRTYTKSAYLKIKFSYRYLISIIDTANNKQNFAIYRLNLPNLDSDYAYGFSITSGSTPHGFHFSYYGRMAFYVKTSTYFNIFITTCTEWSFCHYQIILSGGTIYHSKNFLDISASYDLTSSFIAIDSSGKQTPLFHQYWQFT